MTALADMSPAQLTWTHNQQQRRRIGGDMRSLAIARAAAALSREQNPGDTAEDLMREFKRELKRLCNDSAPDAPATSKSQMPLSVEEFWKMYEFEKSL